MIPDWRLERRLVSRLEVSCIKEVVYPLYERILRIELFISLALRETKVSEAVLTFPPISSIKCAVSCGAKNEYSHELDS